MKTPLPQPLPKECVKASKIVNSFVSSGSGGLDHVIPKSVLQNARGFAIFTVVKAGFVFSARAGSGIVIARLDDGTFSAPSAIGTAGMGFGGQAGAEITDFLVILNSRSAVRSFMSAGSVTLGGNMSIAIGPLGRNGEASGALNTKGKVAAMYSYSRSKGLFGGVSLEGSVIVERQDANAIAYGSDVTAKQLLSGSISVPHWADGLIQTLERCCGGVKGWIEEEPPLTPGSDNYSFTGIGSNPSDGRPSPQRSSSFLRRGPFSSPSGSKRKSSVPVNDYFDRQAVFDGSSHSQNAATSNPFTQPNLMDAEDDDPWGVRPGVSSRSTVPPTSAASFPVHFDSDYTPQSQTKTPHAPIFNNTNNDTQKSPFPDLSTPLNPFNFEAHPSNSPFSSSGGYSSVSSVQDTSYNNAPSSPPLRDSFSPKPIRSLSMKKGIIEAPKGSTIAIALFDFSAKEAGDLTFKRGDVIYVTEKTDTTNDWWKGRVAIDGQPGVEGIFPANFVTLEV